MATVESDWAVHCLTMLPGNIVVWLSAMWADVSRINVWILTAGMLMRKLEIAMLISVLEALFSGFISYK